MNWFQLKEKIMFLWQATNAHGLHSPYMFRFYNEVKKQSRAAKLPLVKLDGYSKKEKRIIWAIIHYLKPATSLIISEDEPESAPEITAYLKDSHVFPYNKLPDLSIEPTIFELIYLSKSLIFNEKELLNRIKAFIGNQTIVIIPHIHASKESLNRWNYLINENSVRVSVDLFFAGLLFFRKESSKEDFLLRF